MGKLPKSKATLGLKTDSSADLTPSSCAQSTALPHSIVTSRTVHTKPPAKVTGVTKQPKLARSLCTLRTQPGECASQNSPTFRLGDECVSQLPAANQSSQPTRQPVSLHTPSDPWRPTGQTAPDKTSNPMLGFKPRAESLAAFDNSSSMADALLADESPLALRPVDSDSLRDTCTLMYHINTWGYSLRTVMQDNGSNWRYWRRWCSTFRTPTIRSYYHSKAAIHDQNRERYLWTAAIPWILGQMAPGPGRTFPLPSSAVAVLRGIRRIHLTLGFEPPPSSVLNRCLKAIMNYYVDTHGAEALEPHRTEPIPFATIVELIRLVRSTRQKVSTVDTLTDGASSLFWTSLDCLISVHTDTGFRKAETTSRTKVFTNTGTSRAHLT